MLATTGCEVYIEGEATHSHEHTTTCYEPEPYERYAEEYQVHYNHKGLYVGECGEWYMGQGWYEEWCNWADSCGWEYVGEYRA